jgi:RHS repeat-associated protein
MKLPEKFRKIFLFLSLIAILLLATPKGIFASLPTEKQFTGHVFDSSSDLYYMRARYYDPVIGRFLSPDDQADPSSGGNRYVYSGNNPANFIDPSGHQGTIYCPGCTAEELESGTCTCNTGGLEGAVMGFVQPSFVLPGAPSYFQRFLGWARGHLSGIIDDLIGGLAPSYTWENMAPPGWDMRPKIDPRLYDPNYLASTATPEEIYGFVEARLATRGIPIESKPFQAGEELLGSSNQWILDVGGPSPGKNRYFLPGLPRIDVNIYPGGDPIYGGPKMKLIEVIRGETQVGGNALALPFSSGSVPIYSSNHMFDNVLSNPLFAEEAYRVLEPGGTVHVSGIVPHAVENLVVNMGEAGFVNLQVLPPDPLINPWTFAVAGYK